MAVAKPVAAKGTLEFSRTHHWPLFVVIALTLVAAPFSFDVLGHTGALVLNLLLYAAGAFSVARNTRLLVASTIAGMAAALLQIAIVWGGNRDVVLAVAFHVASIAFVTIVGAHVLSALLRTASVTGDTVLGGVTAYLLLGVLFAFLYSLAETVQPGSFTLPASMTQTGDVMTWIPTPIDSEASESGELHLLYFSFTTMSTLGYGDIAPRSPIARSLSSVESVLGQLYLAIFIARLVSVARMQVGGKEK